MINSDSITLFGLVLSVAKVGIIAINEDKIHAQIMLRLVIKTIVRNEYTLEYNYNEFQTSCCIIRYKLIASHEAKC